MRRRVDERKSGRRRSPGRLSSSPGTSAQRAFGIVPPPSVQGPNPRYTTSEVAGNLHQRELWPKLNSLLDAYRDNPLTDGWLGTSFTDAEFDGPTCLRTFVRIAAHSVSSPEAPSDALSLWDECLKRALASKIFEIDPWPLMQKWRQRKRAILDEELGESTIQSAIESERTWAEGEEIELLAARYAQEARSLPVPKALPFPNCWLTYGGGLSVTAEEVLQDLSGSPATDALQLAYELGDQVYGVILGHLVCETGVWEFGIHVTEGSSEQRGISFTLQQLYGGAWDPIGGRALLIAPLIEELYDHSVFVEGRMPSGDHRGIKRIAKKAGIACHVPPAFYRIVMRDTTRHEGETKPPSGRGPSPGYRHDVRQSEHLRRIQGELPLADKDRKKLRKRGYLIAEWPNNLPKRYRKALRKRHRNPRPRQGEWFAIKLYTVREHQSPSEENRPDLPYVPGVRVSAKLGAPKRRRKKGRG